MTTLWVLGAGGLLGSAVVRAARQMGTSLVGVAIPWSEPVRAEQCFAEIAAGLAASHAAAPDEQLQVAWCAGVGVVASHQSLFDQEAKTVEALQEALVNQLPPSALGRLSVFVASSAGAVYAGGGPAPHDETSPTGALVPYGHAKLRLERQFSEFAEHTGARVVIGRISNLYGPGQDLSKGQGLVSTLLKGALTGSPVNIYVDLDTIRDYLYVDDAAQLVLAALNRVTSDPAGTVTVKVLASQVRTTVSHLISHTRRVASQRPLLALGASPLRGGQARDLSMRSVVWPELNSLASTPLLVGVHRTFLDLQRARMEARL